MIILLQLASFLTAFLIVIAYGSAQPLFEVQREAFCKGIHSHEPVSPFLRVAEIKRGEWVFLWMEITAGERALTMLESRQAMPIYHAWASDAGVTNVIDIGIKKEKWTEQAEAITNEFKRWGFFTWRTYSRKQHFKEGRWYVSILDANKRPVCKAGAGTGAFRPEIVIKFIPNQ